MKKSLWIPLLILVLILGLFGCRAQPQQDTTQATQPPAPTAPPEPTPAEHYAEACKPVREATDLNLRIKCTKDITVGNYTTTAISEQERTMTALNTDAMHAQTVETYRVGEYNASFLDTYADGTFYTAVVDAYRFKGEMSQEEYLAGLIPAILLDPDNYESVTLSEQWGEKKFTFADASLPETWALPEGAQFDSASGTAAAGPEGDLKRSTYQIAYRHGAAQVEMTVEVLIQPVQEAALPVPDSDPAYIAVTDVEGIRLYEEACLSLWNSTNLSMTGTESYLYQLADGSVTNLVDMAYSWENGSCVADLTEDVLALAASGESTDRINNHYEDGTLVTTYDDGEQTSEALSADETLYRLQTVVTRAMVTIDDFKDIMVNRSGETIILEIVPSEEYATLLNEDLDRMWDAGQAMFEEAQMKLQILELRASLAMDACTGFPTAAELLYNAGYIIDGQPYALGMQSTRALNLADTMARQKATGAPMAEQEPEEKARPLFYKVTGADGQQMWLMGTIHVGDNRTAYLPEEIYAALESSAALAVEFNPDAFYAELEADPALAGEVAMLYLNSDFATMDAILAPESYERACLLMRAAGSMDDTYRYFQPFFWESTISNFYLQQGYNLVSEKGVDNRLMAYANEKNIPIRDVESGLSQLQMMADFSQELQVLLLEETLDYTASAYCADVEALYELWCAGDEAAIAESLSSEIDTAEMTQEELAEYEACQPLLEEYNNAMSYTRNAYMLEVARSYLESDEVVFFAVGLAHLLDGENGLIRTLEEAGYTVELVTYN